MSTLKKPFSLVFIAGLGHSGSTLLSLLLGSQKDFSSLGEVNILIEKSRRNKYLKKYDKRPCSCGKLPTYCDVWGSFKKYLTEDTKLSYNELYAKLLEIHQQKSGGSTIIDASKNFNHLKKIVSGLDEVGISKSQFYVIHLTKDVRNYTYSMLRRGESESIINTFKHFRNWTKRNRKVEQYLKENEIQTLNIGYEELALSTDLVFKKLFDFLGYKPVEGKISVISDPGHVIFGNKMKNNDSIKIKYDYYWLNDGNLNLYYSLLYPFINKLNSRLVYNTVNQIAKENNKRFKFKTEDFG